MGLQDRKDTKRVFTSLRNDKDGKRTKKLDLSGKKYAIFSDLHLGDGKSADNFVKNERIFEKALRYYGKQEFEIVLLGDIEEFWQFDPRVIHERYKKIYGLLQGFGKELVHRVFGNHDHEYMGLSDPARGIDDTFSLASEAILFGKDVLATHGHQGEPQCTRWAWASRFFVRTFAVVEPAAIVLGYENEDAPLSPVPKDREVTYYEWAAQSKVKLICGHTHRAFFGSLSYVDRLKEQINKLEERLATKTSRVPRVHKGSDPRDVPDLRNLRKLRELLETEIARGRNAIPVAEGAKPVPCYFNSGCGLYRNGITNLELESGQIRLVKWDEKKGRDESYSSEAMDLTKHD